ncbi:MAG: type III-A CRISPR-associated RAMP protein Csm4 [Anaerolineae bacterium]|jgi:CRISPR-associated protein Csm4|nr:type III-A CRISPR-associated RAMP protein Csm4 [Anaerolineae bacterium]
MAHKAYKFTFKTGLHPGREGLALESSGETFPSDSLFSAIISELAVLDPKLVPEILAAFNQSEPPFRLSSLYPILGDLPLFPMPRLQLQYTAREGQHSVKLFKKLAYVSPIILRRILTHQNIDDWLPNEANPESSRGRFLQGGAVWIDADEVVQLPPRFQNLSVNQMKEAKFWSIGTVSRVTIDRITNESNIYQVGRTFFASECGLWLLADIHQYEDALVEVLYHLGDTGIGGERSAGYGSFELYSIPVPEIPLASHGPQAMTLSRYNPTLEELNQGVLGENAAYELVDIGGWFSAIGAAGQRRKRIRFIEAGSILDLRQTPTVTGRLVDVRPPNDLPGSPRHPIIRSGIALLIGAGKREHP